MLAKNKNGIILAFVIHLCLFKPTKSWDLKKIAKLSQALAEKYAIGCLSIRHPPDLSTEHYSSVFQLTKLMNQNPKNIRNLKVHSMTDESKLKDWTGCSQVLTILLIWLPNGQEAFLKFIENALINDPVWITVLPKTMTYDNFFKNINIPFQVRIISTTYSKEDEISLYEVWRAAPGFPLRSGAHASWDENKLICSKPRCTFEERNDLDGAPIRASTKDDMPISGLKCQNGDCKIGGYFGAIFYDVMRQLNASTILVPSTDNRTGSEIEGKWNGLIGMMKRNETDLSVGPMTYHTKTLEVASFVPPVLRTHYQVFFKQAGTVIEWDAYFKPFGKYIWRLILIWMITSTLAYSYCYKVACQIGLEDSRYLQEFSKLNSMMTFFRAFCQQGANLTPKSSACRALHMTGYAASAILLTAYSASLISKLTLQVPLRPFDSLETFLEDGSYKLSAISRSTDYTYFSEATDPLLSNIYNKMMKSTPENDLPRGKEDGMDKVCHQHKVALFITFAVTQITASEFTNKYHCPILWFSSPLGRVFLTIGIRKDMPYARLISKQFLIMTERGVSRRRLKENWPLQTKETPEIKLPQLELKQVAQIHCILIGGATLALLILGIERIMKNHILKMKIRRIIVRSRCDEDTAVSIIFCLIAALTFTTIIANVLS